LSLPAPFLTITQHSALPITNLFTMLL